MPSIKTEGNNAVDRRNLWAVMLWPQDAERRRQYSALDHVNSFVYENHESTVLTLEASLVQSLLEAPSWEQLGLEARQNAKRAIVASHVFTYMFLMHRLRRRLPPRGAHGASLSKAFFLAAKWAREGATYGDDTSMYASKKSVKDCWREYRSVVHLWGAMALNRIAPFSPDFEILNPEHFSKFMRVAAYLQKFGITHQLDNKSKKSSDPLLPSDLTWLVDTKQYTPTIYMLPELLDAESMFAMLWHYNETPN